MAKSGYIVFGRAYEHEYVSNGIIQELNYSRFSYLDIEFELKPKDTFASITKYKAPNESEVTLILINSYAESFNGREGGFIGAGVAFIGAPTSKMMLKLANLHKESLKQLDEHGKFKRAELNKKLIKLPELNEREDLISNYLKKYKQKENSSFGVLASGNFYNELLSTAQGVTFHPDFSKFKKVFVSTQNELLSKLTTKKTWSYKLHDYNSLWMKLEKEHNKILEKNKELQSEVSKLEKEKKKLKENKTELKNDYNTLESEKEGLEKEIDELNQSINETRNKSEESSKKLKHLENTIQQNFEKNLRDPRFEEQLKKFEKDILEKKERELKHDFDQDKKSLNKNIDELKGKNHSKKNEIKIITAFSLTTILLLSFFLIFNSYNKNEAIATTPKLPAKESFQNKPDFLKIELPEEMSTKELYELNDTELKRRKENIDLLIDLAINVNNDISRNAKKKLIETEWKFYEILDENIQDDIQSGLKRLQKIKDNYEKIGIEDKSLFEPPRFLILGKGIEIKDEEFEFDGDPGKLFENYLENTNNIYSSLGFDIDVKKSNTYDAF